MTQVYYGNTAGREETINGSIYVSQDCYDNVGADPAHVVAKHLQEIFNEDYLPNPFYIYVMDSRSDCPMISDLEDVDCDNSNGAYDEFYDYIKNGEAPTVGEDFNLLITNLERGVTGDGTVGCGGISGNVSVAEGGPQIAGEDVNRYHGTSHGEDALQTAIHEVGHNLGMHHRTGRKRFIDTDNDGATEYTISPLAPGPNQDNRCGYSTPDNDGSQKVLDMHYYFCARQDDEF